MCLQAGITRTCERASRNGPEQATCRNRTDPFRDHGTEFNNGLHYFALNWLITPVCCPYGRRQTGRDFDLDQQYTYSTALSPKLNCSFASAATSTANSESLKLFGTL